MIVSCTECNAKFNLDESLIKTEGSRVRCSQCKHVFTVYPPQLEEIKEAEDAGGIDEPAEDFSDDLLEETVALDSPPDFSRIEGDSSEADSSEDTFEKTFEDVLEDDLAEGVEDFIGDEKVALILGDNIFYGSGMGKILRSINDPDGGGLSDQNVCKKIGA